MDQSTQEIPYYHHQQNDPSSSYQSYDNLNNNYNQSQNQNPGQSNKHKRRTRNESQLDRNYTCGCGKSYLSYPALYLHLKNKHEGKPPEGTQLANNNGKGSRGRPKKEDNGERYKDEDTFIDNDEAIILLVNYLETLEKHFKREDKLNQKSYEFIQKLLDAFPKDEFFPNNKNEFQNVIQYLDGILRGNESLQDQVSDNDDYGSQSGDNNQNLGVNDSQSEDKPKQGDDQDQMDDVRNTKFDKIIAIFIYKLSKYVSFQCIREIAYFLLLYRKSLNYYGWDIYKKMQQNNMTTPQKQQSLNKQPSGDFTSLNNGEYALEICNDFIIKDLQKYLQEAPFAIQKNLMILGDSESCIKNAVYITQYFTDWLFDNNYTSSKLQITNEQFKDNQQQSQQQKDVNQQQFY